MKDDNLDDEQRKETFKLFEDLQDDEISDEKVKQAEEKADRLGKFAEDFLVLIDMIKAYWNGSFTIPRSDLLLIIGAIAYVALPFDIVPDIIPVLGFTDDIIVVGLVLKKLGDLVERFKRQKATIKELKEL